jgi:hypothetical protein
MRDRFTLYDEAKVPCGNAGKQANGLLKKTSYSFMEGPGRGLFQHLFLTPEAICQTVNIACTMSCLALMPPAFSGGNTACPARRSGCGFSAFAVDRLDDKA